MKKILQLYTKIAFFIIFLFALILFVVHFTSLLYGFYFTGDTITFFVPAFPGHKGDLFSVFLWYYPSFAPGISFIFNLLRILPFSFMTQHHIYLILSTIFGVLVTLLIARKITPVKKWQVVIVTLLLFTGSQSLLFLTALSEPLFISLWLATILMVERFMSTKQERYLLLFMVTGGLMAFVKYQGMYVLLGFDLIIIAFTFATWRQKKYSVGLVLTTLILAWVPILVSALRNYIIYHYFFGYFDPQIDPAQKKLSYHLIYISTSVLKDSFLLLIAALAIGTQIKWNKVMKNLIIISLVTSATYYSILSISMSQIKTNQALPLRYFLPPYPELLLLAICLGSIIIHKFPKLIRLFIPGMIIVIFVFAINISASINRLKSEIESPNSFVKGWDIHSGAEHSADIKRLCRVNKPNRYLLLQDSSRNWVAQSLGFYCRPIEIISLKEPTFKFPANSTLFSPYQIEHPKLEVEEVYKGVKNVNVYKTTEEIILDTGELSKKLDPLD